MYLIAWVAGVWLTGCAGGETADESPPEYRNLAADVRYVGTEACSACHADKVETFLEAEMGRSLKPAHPQQSAARFEGVEPVYDEALDLYYEPMRRGDDLFVTEFRLSDGDTVHKRTERIDFIVGSGQHTNSHIMSVNGYLYQMPLTWYAQEGKWDLPPGFDAGNNSRFDRPIPEACMTCHNAMPVFVAGSESRFAEVPTGIDCERCHGPGELHVAEKEQGVIVDTSAHIDRSIVNPARLPIDLQFDVCSRCHMQGATVFKPGMGPADFRPGMPLADVMNVFWPRYADSTEQFIMASHPDRLRMSACFQASRAQGEATGEPGGAQTAAREPMTCTTCHDPHVSIETLGPDHYRSSCLTCHDAGDGMAREGPGGSPVPSATLPACTEDLEIRRAADDDCTQCHMPVSGSTDIPHVSITDHYIRVVETVDSSTVEAARRFVGLASLIDASPSERERAEGYMTYFEEVQDRPDFLDSATVHLDRARSEEPLARLAPSLVRLNHLKRDFEATIQLNRDLSREELTDPWMLYRIGEAYQSRGDAAAAIPFLEDAVRLAPDHLRFQNELGTAYTEARRLGDALETFRRVLAANPKSAEARNNRGFVRILTQDLEGAEEDFLEALRLDPDAEMALANLASLYLNTNRMAEARPYARRLLDAHPDDPNYQQLWALVR